MLPLALLLHFVHGGCGGTPDSLIVDGVEVEARAWRRATTAITPQAVVEIECSATALEYRLLRALDRAPERVRVSGCGRHAVYEREILRNAVVGEWHVVRRDGEAVD